jgi:DnaJ-domain-containing protein 1
MTEALAKAIDVRRLVGVLAAHPILPPIEAVSSDTEALRSVLADLARGEDSSEVETLRAVAADLVVPVEELIHRAQFVLACLVLPPTGTHYEVLGVEPDATPQEIRRRWAELIQRYHPDRFGGTNSWLDGQARRLIEAYHTLKDPDRRQTYDAQLAYSAAAVPLPASQIERVRPGFGPSRWRWAPIGMAAVSIVVFLWALARPAPAPLPKASLPPAPKLLESRSLISPVAAADPAPRPRGVSEVLRGPDPDPRGVTEVPRVPDAPSPDTRDSSSMRDRLRTVATVAPSTVPRAAADDIPERPPGWTPSSAGAPATPAAAPSGGGRPALASASPSPLPGSAPAVPPTAEPSRASSIVLPPQAASTVPDIAALPTTAPAAGQSARAEPVQPSRPSVPRDELLAIIERYRVAYERKDLDTLIGLCSADVRDRRASGRTSVKQLYERHFSALDGIRYDLTGLEVAAAGPEQFVATARFQIRAIRVRTSPRQLDASGSVRWQLRRESGTLRITAIDYEQVRL